MNLGFFKEFMPYGLLSVIVLVIFYGIYYTKMIIQKRQGIKTKQIGSRKEKKLYTVETLMAIATYLIVVVEVLSIVFNYNLMPSNGRINGIFIGLCGDCVFLFAIICMKDSWRAGIPEKDQTKLVTNVRYSWGISGILNQNSVNSEFVKRRPNTSRSSFCLFFVYSCFNFQMNTFTRQNAVWLLSNTIEYK